MRTTAQSSAEQHVCFSDILEYHKGLVVLPDSKLHDFIDECTSLQQGRGCSGSDAMALVASVNASSQHELQGQLCQALRANRFKQAPEGIEQYIPC